ncbi:FRG domain-containing protein [Phaeobacter sp. JH20_36]|uniref:FRG domain-containing protein n=1 Tax=unclassified Phaeobacter TaxID=2621772 RepID=UPI003A8ADA8B
MADSVGQACLHNRHCLTSDQHAEGSARPGGVGSEAPAPWGAGRALPGLRPGGESEFLYGPLQFHGGAFPRNTVKANLSMDIESLSDFFDAVKKELSEHSGRQVFFRGHSKTDYKLEPSVFRTKNWRESEHLMLRQMLAENPKDFEGDNSTFDKLVRAQHYGLPTRLLDISTNPFVALYFACCSNNSHDGKVLVISSSKQRHKYFDSDTVSLLSNLAFLKRSEKDELLSYAKSNVPERAIQSERVKLYEKCPSLDKLLQTIRAEKNFFRSQADPFDLAYVVSVTPRKTHERIKAQEGQFLLFGMNESDQGTHLENLKITEIDISEFYKNILLSELAQFGVSEKTLFPEIEKSAIQIRQRYS